MPLTKLSFASETAQSWLNMIFASTAFLQILCQTTTNPNSNPQFISQVWRSFCQALSVTTSPTSGYHPQSNVLTETCNQKLEATLRCVIENNLSTWSQHLPYVEYAHNSQMSSTTGLSPVEASMSYFSPIIPFSGFRNSSTISPVTHQEMLQSLAPDQGSPP